MDFGGTPLLELMKTRLDWLDQRQQVLARNIANADTPAYRPRDVVPLRFNDLLAPERPGVSVVTTDPAHLAGDGGLQSADPQARPVRRVFETAPAGNGVILEEQMAKVNETAADHRLVTQLYRKYLGMARLALGSKA
jgi:flagellar basal-body rod protein FlgB